jgi:AcrR family transcriptional regulator
MATATDEGLRERKKRATREAIAAAAMRLFAERGFDEVTVAGIARAADVSEKTVFNYFPAKEDLVFSRGADRQAALIAALRECPRGVPLTEPFRRLTHAFLDTLEAEPLDDLTVVPRLVAGSSALRERLFLGWEREIEVLAPVLAEQAGVPEHDLVARVVARSLAWAHRLVFRAALEGLVAGRPRGELAAELRVQADRAYDQLERGLATYGSDQGGLGRDGVALGVERGERREREHGQADARDAGEPAGDERRTRARERGDAAGLDVAEPRAAGDDDREDG